MSVFKTKLSHKLFIRMSLIVGCVFLIMYAANTWLMPKYVLYQKKQKLASITRQLESLSGKQLEEKLQQLKHNERITVAVTSFPLPIDELNELMRDKLGKEGITLSKFWITEESIVKLRQGELVNKIYGQEKLKSSFLVTFMMKEDQLYAIGESIAFVEETLASVNRFMGYVFIGALGLTMLLSGLFARHIGRPLVELQKTAEDISNLTFRKASIHTGDELETLSVSINEMSDKLQQAHEQLERKNDNLRWFISDVSHELKTPLALMNAYASGIKDGLDDGTYIDVIQGQAQDMARMVDRLLELSKLQAEQYTMTNFDLGLLVEETLSKYQGALRQQGLCLSVDVQELTRRIVTADRDKIATVLNNYITNAIKYTTKSNIRMVLHNEGSYAVLSITNAAAQWTEAELERLWEPFVVADESRSKELSGTGLGLSLVRVILEQHEVPYGVRAEHGEITFYVSLRLAEG